MLRFSIENSMFIAGAIQRAVEHAEGRIHSAEAAAGLMWKHSKLVHGLDRIISMLPPEFVAAHFQRTTYRHRGQDKPAYMLNREALPFLFLTDARKVEVLWTKSMIEG